MSDPKATRNGFGDALVELGSANSNVVVVDADLSKSTKTFGFSEKFPDRFFNVGIAEQNLIGIGTGLALGGKIPFVASFAVFITGRAFDQIRTSVAYNKANVRICGSHAGITVGEDGATHQALEDIALMRSLPNMTVLVPCDYNETKRAVFAAANHDGPVYIRYGRPKVPIVTSSDTPFEIGKANVLRSGKDCTIVSCGGLLSECLKAADLLSSEGVSVGVVNMHTVKPIDRECLVGCARGSGCIVTVEEHQIHGGLGGAVSEVLGGSCPVPIEMVAVQDTFGVSGKPADLLEKFGLTASSIVEKVKKAIARKQ